LASCGREKRKGGGEKGGGEKGGGVEVYCLVLLYQAKPKTGRDGMI